METDFEFTWVIPHLKIENVETCYSNGEQYYVLFYDYPYFDENGDIDFEKNATSISISIGADIVPTTYDYFCCGKNENEEEWFLNTRNAEGRILPPLQVKEGIFKGSLELVNTDKNFPEELKFLKERLPSRDSYTGKNYSLRNYIIYISDEEKEVIDNFVKPLVNERFFVEQVVHPSSSSIYGYNGETFDDQKKYDVLNHKGCCLIFKVERLHFEYEKGFLSSLKDIVHDKCVINNFEDDYDEGFDDLEESVLRHKRRLRY